MPLRRLWIVSIPNKTLLYCRSFPSVEKQCRSRLDVTQLPHTIDSQFAGLVLKALTIQKDNNDGHYDFSLINQLPVIELECDGVKVWPVVIIEHNGLLFCGLSLTDHHVNHSRSLIDHQSITLTLSTLQHLASYFIRENKLSKLEYFITSNLPFGTIIDDKTEVGQKKTVTSH